MIDPKLYSSISTILSEKSPPIHTLPMTFDNKALELTRIPQALNHLEMIETLPSNLESRKVKTIFLRKCTSLVMPL